MAVSKTVLSYDFIIVGAGIAGASLAFELSRVARVCLIEAEDRPDYHSTGRSAALYAPTYGNKPIRALTRASRPFFDAPPDGFCEYALLSPRGALFIAREDQRTSADVMLDELRSSSEDVHAVSGQAARQQVPLLRESYVVSAIVDASAMDIDVNGLHQGYLRGARAAGTRLITGAPLNRVSHQAGQWQVTLAAETCEAPVLVNAAGAWADQVAHCCGAKPLGLKPLRRTAALVDVPALSDFKDWPAVIDVDETFYFKPEAGKLLISPADETPVDPGDVQPDDLDVALAIDRVETALDINVRRVIRSWSGLRTFAADRTPVVGYDPGLKGFFWCAGQGGYGIQTAPAMARAAAALAQCEALPADIRAERVDVMHLSPARFSL